MILLHLVNEQRRLLSSIVVCCVLLFSILEASVRSPRDRQRTRLIGDLHPDSYLGFLVCSTNHVNDYKYRGDQTNQLHWLVLLHTSYISLLNQAGKIGSSIQSVNDLKPDPRNIFDKQIALFIDILLRDSARE